MRNIYFKNQPLFPKNHPVPRILAAILPIFSLPMVLLAQTSTVDAGLRFEQKKGETYPIVSQVWKFSSAEDEEIQQGEILWALDGASAEGLKPKEVLSRLGGKEGDKHTLQIGADKREVKVKLRRLKGKCASGECSTGRGVWDEPDARYEGDFVKGKFEGKGVMSYLSGNRHEGEYRAGKREGAGKFIFATGTVYEGNFSNNNFNGKGSLKYKTGETYEGEFVNDERTGEGTGSWPNGDHYEGHWIADLRNGQGVMTYADGSRYDGVWKDGKRHGFGRMISFEGWSYEGNWHNELRHGFGKLRKKSGERVEGIFQNDEQPANATSSGAVDPAEIAPAPIEMNREDASMMAENGTSAPVAMPQKSVLESKAIADFLQNSVPESQKKTASPARASPPAPTMGNAKIGALRPSGTDNLPTAATRKLPSATAKDVAHKTRMVKVIDGFFDNAAAADTWLVDNERIIGRTDRTENIKGLGVMAATWAASAKNNLENFGKDVKLPNQPKATEVCDQFLATNSKLAEKYNDLSKLLSSNVDAQKEARQSQEIEKVRAEISRIWPSHEAQYLAARKLFF